MSDLKKNKSIWFVYDGECPLCRSAATALRIKKDYGDLHIVNARDSNEEIVRKVNQAGLDLDEGMVIYDGITFYHGKDALGFMAKYSENKGAFNRVNKLFFWSKSLSVFMYPYMRGVRNFLIRRKNISRIDNLNLKKEPIFKSIFAENWDDMPIVMHKHYANCPYTDDVTIVNGEMDISCSGPIRFFSPIIMLLGGVPALNQTGVPVTVSFKSDMNTKAFGFNRVFHFHDQQAYQFESYMLQREENEVIEVMKFGFTWRMHYLWQDGCVKLLHKGYALKVFDYLIPLPLTALLGSANAEERAVDENTFDMQVVIAHPWWGNVYEYKGQFRMDMTL